MGKLKSSRNFGGPKESSGDCHESSELKFKSRGQQLISNPFMKNKTMVKGVTTLECNICGTPYITRNRTAEIGCLAWKFCTIIFPILTDF